MEQSKPVPIKNSLKKTSYIFRLYLNTIYVVNKMRHLQAPFALSVNQRKRPEHKSS